jgi:hypothetical protein
MPDVLQDPRTLLLSKINIETSRVEFAQSHIVLLCGGKVKYKERPDDPDPPVVSLRHAITHSNSVYETYRPEDITDWHSDGIFKNLMHFEEDLAGICSLVVIILESPGSIAELGAFSQLPDLSKKIIAVKSREFEDKTSFINLGILRFIKENHESGVKSYPWSTLRPEAITAEIVADVVSDIQEELDKLPRSLVFKIALNSHVVVLIRELVNLFRALKETEILEYLIYFKVTISREQLKRKLFLLEKFRLLKKETYSDSTFYMLGKSEYHKLRLALKEDVIHDTIRTQIECLAYYKDSPKQRNRIRAIQQSLAGLA